MVVTAGARTGRVCAVCECSDAREGIYFGHAYAIDNVVEVNDGDETRAGGHARAGTLCV